METKANDTKISKSFQEEFLDELVKNAGFNSEDIELIKDDLRPILQERIMLHIYKEINEEQIQQVGEFFKQEEYDKLTEYLKGIIPNFEDFLYEIYAQFEDEYLENFER